MLMDTRKVKEDGTGMWVEARVAKGQLLRPRPWGAVVGPIVDSRTKVRSHR